MRSRTVRRSASLKGHTQALEGLVIEMLARELSVRDIADAFNDESGRLLLSKTAGVGTWGAAVGGTSRGGI